MPPIRKAVIALGVLELLVAGFFFLLEGGVKAKFNGRESIYAAMAIVEDLEARGELLVPADRIEAGRQEAAVSRIVREKLELSGSSTPVHIGTLAGFGVLVLLTGLLIRDHRDTGKLSQT